MSEKRFTIKPQDCYWGITDNFSPDKVNIINGLHTKIEAKWVCAFLNEQQEEISYWKHRVSSLLFILSQFDNDKVKKLLEELDEREKI